MVKRILVQKLATRWQGEMNNSSQIRYEVAWGETNFSSQVRHEVAGWNEY